MPFLTFQPHYRPVNKAEVYFSVIGHLTSVGTLRLSLLLYNLIGTKVYAHTLFGYAGANQFHTYSNRGLRTAAIHADRLEGSNPGSMGVMDVARACQVVPP